MTLWLWLCAIPYALAMHGLTEFHAPVALALALFAITLSLEITLLTLPLVVAWAVFLTPKR